MVRDNRHASVYLFGALCPARATGAAIVMPWVNSEAMSEHLRVIAKAVAPGAHAVLVCDGAGWHQRGERLTVPDNITLLSLPPYSPELNPMAAKIPTHVMTMALWRHFANTVRSGKATLITNG